MKVFLRDPLDDRYDGLTLIVDGGRYDIPPDHLVWEERFYMRVDVRCGTATWTEYWLKGHEPPPDPPRGRRR